ncbi:MAG: cytochrome c [Methylococcaceae bacterium]|jgi:cytochrome c553|nr:cytochrome c [Methylococcaceae bacterium]
MKKSIMLASLILAVPGGTAQAVDIQAGKEKASTICASCHGINGISATDGFPNLAGQKAGYLTNALKAYREGSRKAPIMNNMAANLSDHDIENLAAHFSGLKPTP